PQNSRSENRAGAWLRMTIVWKISIQPSVPREADPIPPSRQMRARRACPELAEGMGHPCSWPSDLGPSLSALSSGQERKAHSSLRRTLPNHARVAAASDRSRAIDIPAGVDRHLAIRHTPIGAAGKVVQIREGPATSIRRQLEDRAVAEGAIAVRGTVQRPVHQ